MSVRKLSKRIHRNNWTLSKKLALSIFFSMLISLAFGVGVLYGRVYRGLVSMNNNLNENNLEGARDNIDQMVQSVENQVTIIILNKEFRSYIMNSAITFDDTIFFNCTNELTVQSMVSLPYLRNISILKYNNSAFYSESSLSGPSYMVYTDYKNKLSNSENKLTNWGGVAGWYSPNENPLGSPPMDCFIHVREIINLNDEESVALMLLYMDESAVFKRYDFFGAGSFAMDNKGTIVSSKNKSIIGTSILNTDLYREVIASGKETISGEYEDNEGKKSFSCTYLPALSCYIVAVPDNSVFSIVQKAILITTGYLLFFGIIFSLILAYILAKRMASPIAKLKYAMAQVRSGNLDTRFSGGNTDEITYLGNSFNILMDTIETYIKNIKEREEEKRQSELRLLQAQINPHLLYNTLDSALYLLSRNKVQKARGAIEALSEFFKLSLSKGRMLVSIETELYHVKQYMEIQRLCRDKDIILEITADNRILKQTIVKMTLQPIVENAFIHAFTGEINTGHILVDISEEREHIVISLTDDGMGMDKEELSRVQLLLSNPKGNGQSFGLWNVNQRLKSCFGEDCGLKISSEFGEYTRVTVIIPSDGGICNV